MNRAAQRQAGALSDVSIDIFYYDGSIVITNTGRKDIFIVRYGIDGQRMDRRPRPEAVAHGDSFTLTQDWISEKAGRTNELDPLLFRITLKAKDGTEYQGECILHLSRVGDVIKGWYGPTSLTRHEWTAPNYGK
jgi:hypothetical protein